MHRYLPKLDDDANVGAPARAGHWHGYQSTLLTSVGEGIVPDEAAKERGVSSVPDVWARPLLFASALRSKGEGRRRAHPMRGRLLAEWRGLMSLLALRQIYTYEVEIVGVPLEGGGAFATALSNLAPPPVRLEEGVAYPWTDLLLIRYKDIPVGAFSPATLVYTAVDYARALRALKPPLCDPETGLLQPPDNPQELEFLGEWLERFQRHINDKQILWGAQDNPDRDGVSLINHLLSEWLTELRGQTAQRGGAPFDAREVEVGEDVLASDQAKTLLGARRIYQELARPLQWAERADAPSPVSLTSKRNLSAYSQVLVITRPLLDRSPELWRGQRARNLGNDMALVLEQHFRDASGDRFGNTDLSRDKAGWIRPEKYFLSDFLVRASDGAGFASDPLRELNLGGQYLLPFRKTILDFFAPDEIARVLKPRFKETPGGIRFEFTLPVAMEPQTIERTYVKAPTAAQDGTLLDIPVPVVEIFPRCFSPQWRRYWMLHNDVDKIDVSPVVTGTEQSMVTRVRRDPEGRAVRLTALVADARDVNGELLPAFPEALTFAKAEGGPPLGLLLLPRKADTDGLQGSWTIGVDFGTSNTNVYRDSESADKAERWQLKFHDSVLHVTSASRERSDDLLERFFVPARDISFPVPTALRVFEETQRELPIVDFGIPFPRESGMPYPDGYRFPTKPLVHTNLKWDTEDRKTSQFLEALLLYLLVDAGQQRVRSMKLTFSYPKAFSDNDIGILKSEWKQVEQRLLRDEKTRVTPLKEGTEVDRPQFEMRAEPEVEGIAAGEFFTHDRTTVLELERADKNGGAICLDVGGGTTDISIWFGEEIALDASLLLAGRQVSELLAKRPRLLEKVFSAEAATSLMEAASQPNAFAARLNLILKHEDARIQERLVQHANQPDVLWLKRLLIVQYGAIAAYSAALLAHADREQDGAIKSQVAMAGIKLHWGGNAAKLINWIDFGRFDADGLASRMLNAILINCLRDYGFDVPPAHVAQRQSPGHKSEVAGGLVVMVPGGKVRKPASVYDDSEPTAGGMVSGEDLTLKTGEISSIDKVSNATLFSGDRTLLVNTSLTRFKRFVDITNRFAVRFGLFANDARIDIEKYEVPVASRLRADYAAMARVEEGKRQLEPPFIVEVRTLLRLLRDES